VIILKITFFKLPFNEQHPLNKANGSLDFRLEPSLNPSVVLPPSNASRASMTTPRSCWRVQNYRVTASHDRFQITSVILVIMAASSTIILIVGSDSQFDPSTINEDNG
jgi:hypothetical protein